MTKEVCIISSNDFEQHLRWFYQNSTFTKDTYRRIKRENGSFDIVTLKIVLRFCFIYIFVLMNRVIKNSPKYTNNSKIWRFWQRLQDFVADFTLWHWQCQTWKPESQLLPKWSAKILNIVYFARNKNNSPISNYLRF